MTPEEKQKLLRIFAAHEQVLLDLIAMRDSTPRDRPWGRLLSLAITSGDETRHWMTDALFDGRLSLADMAEALTTPDFNAHQALAAVPQAQEG